MPEGQHIQLRIKSSFHEVKCDSNRLLKPGDKLFWRVHGDDFAHWVIPKPKKYPKALAGIMKGMYPPDYLERGEGRAGVEVRGSRGFLREPSEDGRVDTKQPVSFTGWKLENPKRF